MFNFLLSRAKPSVAQSNVQSRYASLKMRALFGVFIGYSAYYFVRSNFTLSTPYLMKVLNLSKTDVGLLSSCLLITYGISKGVMSVMADKFNPKYYMMFGLVLSCIVNLSMGFGTEVWMFVVLVIFNGLFQGMGAGPAFITIESWFPRSQRGRISAVWGISHNVGAGMVAPIAVGAFALFGAEHWRAASYCAPAAVSAIVVLVVLMTGAGTTYNEGLPPLEKILPTEAGENLVKGGDHAPDNMSALEIFRRYVLPNKHVWYVALVDSFVYLIRFGVITWLPIYLLQAKGFTKAQMSISFAVFEWQRFHQRFLPVY
ncbi:MFS transporter [Paraburkholderia susongensis]|uniref:Major Facilitator Superfamily protein n=1 Tax=Paraburkholderia susongensis TaxID=1515439 RepID=A0A1X7M4I1_9BURK|nr:MFS transporter [Paraburkholderia susongensis]SMG61098.1 Major Facilitator Superfamily protein [Paraburkholderia susongensis]